MFHFYKIDVHCFVSVPNTTSVHLLVKHRHLLFCRTYYSPLMPEDTPAVRLSDPEQVKGIFLQATRASNRVVLPSRTESLSIFFSVSIPALSADDYARRLYRYMRCSQVVYVYALVLLDKCARKDSRLRLHSYNLNRLLITALMLAAKFVDDQYFSNKYYASVGGVPSLAEMNLLEIEMLKLLDYNLYLPPSEVEKYFVHSPAKQIHP